MNGLDTGVLPDPGTPAFFPAILAQIRGAAPHLALDPVLLQALLLCLLAGNKHLILRTREDDIGPVSKLAVSVSDALLIDVTSAYDSKHVDFGKPSNIF